MRKQLLVPAIVATFGFLVPWYKGLDFLDPVLIVAYSCIGIFFVAPATAEAFAGIDPVPTPAEMLRRGAIILAYGWGVNALILAAGIATVSATHWHGSILAPPVPLLIACLLFSLSACVAVIAGCSLLARRFSPGAVKGFIRLFFLIVLAALVLGNRLLPQEAAAHLAVRMTSEGITHLALAASAILACAGAALAGANAIARRKPGPADS